MSSEIERHCDEVSKMLGDLDPKTATSVLTGVLALHLSRAYGSYATEALDAEYVPAVRALIKYHQHGKQGLQ